MNALNWNKLNWIKNYTSSSRGGWVQILGAYVSCRSTRVGGGGGASKTTTLPLPCII